MFPRIAGYSLGRNNVGRDLNLPIGNWWIVNSGLYTSAGCENKNKCFAIMLNDEAKKKKKQEVRTRTRICIKKVNRITWDFMLPSKTKL